MEFWRKKQPQPNRSNVPAKAGNNQGRGVAAQSGQPGKIVPDRKIMEQTAAGWPVPKGNYTPETRLPGNLLDACKSEFGMLKRYTGLTDDVDDEVKADRLSSLDPVKQRMYAVLFDLRQHGAGATNINFLIPPDDAWAPVMELLFEQHVHKCLPSGPDGVVAITPPSVTVTCMGRKAVSRKKKVKEIQPQKEAVSASDAPLAIESKTS